MLSQMSNLRDVPKPVQAAALVAGGGGITAALILIPATYAIALVIGLTVAVAAMLLYRRMLKWQGRRKSAPMEDGVLRSGAPQLRKADEKVKIDNLRTRFEEGIGRFREAGKNLYSLPWFMIVGEPGSGKTEAIRHCNVGFPPGLQDEYQGVGGTINMNWWFTNNGVIIDTAGRLMFEDVETGGTKEWREFLNLLKKYRPYCPINGVFLVIPADSLVKDTAEQIQQKASKIAQQFNVIQRTLAVRFPVFVVVAKCDLVMGFREFFDGLSHPELQHQIFGWSNPAMIDQPYNRDFVRQHLQTVQDRLRRRRLSLLLELAGDDAAARESTSVNALYSFPKSLAQLAPRMARYLDLIFGAGGEWGAKPIFFRGIYFTSSMQEGAALDEDLAQALGISVESLPAGPAWTRDRAYFLRDLFVKKVFPEKGLVSTAVNASKHYVRRRMVFWLSVAAAVLFLLIYTIYAEIKFENTVGLVKNHVAKAAIAMKDHSLDMVEFSERDGSYDLLWNEETGVVDAKVPRCEFYSHFKGVIDHWEQQRTGRWLLLPLTKLSKIDTDQLRRARKNVFEYTAVRSFYEETCELLASPPSVENWTVNSGELRVLVQLIKLRSGRTPLPLAPAITTEAPAGPTDEYAANSFFGPFCNYWCDRAVRAKDPCVPATLNAVLADLYVPTPAASAWPPPILNEDSVLNEAAGRSITAAVGRFVKDCDPNNRGNTKALNNLFALLQDFNNAEEELWKLKDRDIGSFRDEKDGWQARFDALKKAKDTIDNLLQNDPNLSAITSIKSKYDELIKEEQGNALKAYDVLLKAFEYDAQKGLPDQIAKTWSNANKPVGILVEGRKKWVELEKDGSQGKLAADLDRKLWGGKERLYQLRYQKYAGLKLAYEYDGPVSVHGDSREKAADVITGDANAVNNTIEKLKKNRPAPEAYGFDEADALCEHALNLAKEERKADVVGKALKTAAPDSAWLTGKIADRVPTAITYLNDWVTFGRYVEKGSTLRKGYDAKDEVYKAYVRDYWLGEYLEKWIDDNIPKKSNWANQHNELSQSKYSFPRVCGDLKNIGDEVDSVVALVFPKRTSQSPTAVKNFRNSYDMVEKVVRNDPYEFAVAKWTKDEKGDTYDAYALQKALLNKRPDTFLYEYFPTSHRNAAPVAPVTSQFVESYWWNLSFETLKVLANEPPGLSPEAKMLLSYYKYPIDPKAEYELTTAEFDKANGIWDNIKDSINEGHQYERGSIGEGIRTDIPPEINALLDRLKGNHESSQKPDEIKKIGGRIDYVSKIRASYDLGLSLCKEGNKRIWQVLQYVELQFVNQKPDFKNSQLITSDAHLGSMIWPGMAFKFNFYDDHGKFLHSFPSPISRQWILMRICDFGGMDPTKKEEARIEWTIKYKGEDYKLTILVQLVQRQNSLRY